MLHNIFFSFFSLKKRLDAEIEAIRLKELLKIATEKVAKLELALKELQSESCNTEEDNTKLRNELNYYESGQQNLSVSNIRVNI